MWSLFKRYNIPHYHGDEARTLFVVSAILVLFAIPLWGNTLPFGNSFEVAAALLFVFLAGFTNPHTRVFLVINMLVAGVGAFLYEMAAITYYETDPFILFLVREVIAIVLIIAFYYSVRTVRAMLLGKIGHGRESDEFE